MNIHGHSYDAENRLISVVPRIPVEGASAVDNRYNHKNLRVRKIVRRYTGGEWTDYATHDFTYDGGNIVLERIIFADGTTCICEYYWGSDLSGTEQGVGGVGGLLYLRVDGAVYIPCYDNNGNVMRYLDATGVSVASYTYDAFGRTISQSGSLADVFRHRFSTKYFDIETGVYKFMIAQMPGERV